jgi:hypothetical protein
MRTGYIMIQKDCTRGPVFTQHVPVPQPWDLRKPPRGPVAPYMTPDNARMSSKDPYRVNTSYAKAEESNSSAKDIRSSFRVMVIV